MTSAYTQFRGLIEDSHEKMRTSRFSGFLEQGIDFDAINFETTISSERASADEALLQKMRKWLIDIVDPERIKQN